MQDLWLVREIQNSLIMLLIQRVPGGKCVEKKYCFNLIRCVYIGSLWSLFDFWEALGWKYLRRDRYYIENEHAALRGAAVWPSVSKHLLQGEPSYSSSVLTFMNPV